MAIPSCRHRCCAICEPGWLPATPPTPTSGETWPQSQVRTTSPAIEGVWPQLARGDSVLCPLPSLGGGACPAASDMFSSSPLLVAHSSVPAAVADGGGEPGPVGAEPPAAAERAEPAGRPAEEVVPLTHLCLMPHSCYNSNS